MQDQHGLGFRKWIQPEAGRKSRSGIMTALIWVQWREVENRAGRRTVGRHLADVTIDWMWEGEETGEEN